MVSGGYLIGDKAQHAHTSDRHPGARRDPLGERSAPRTERATLQRVDTGPVSSTGWHFRRYDNGWRNHVTNQVRL